MEKVKRFCKKTALFLLSISWCALQTVIGCLFAVCLLPTSRTQRYRGMVILYHPFAFTFSLGTFAFISDRVDRPREIRGTLYGHYLQSLLFGPAYLFVVTLPHLCVRIPRVALYRAERGILPEDIFADRQAARLAAKYGE